MLLNHSILLAFFSMFIGLISFSQNVGIGTSTPNPSAKLDVTDSNRGTLVPRVALTAANVSGPVATPAASLLVYNTATAGISPNNVTPGFYFWDGVKWVRFQSQANGLVSDWTTLGNSGTIDGTNFIGTTDAVDFVAKTNNIERMRVRSNGLVGIGLVPSYKFDVTHTSTMADDRAVNINYSTSGNTGGWNTGLNVISNSTANGDVFGILSTTSQSGNGRGAAIAGIVTGSGTGDKIAVASQIVGSGDDGAGLTSAVSGSWNKAYGLMVEFTSVSAIQKRYGVYVKGEVDYSAFMENGDLYVNDNVAIGINADPPQAKLHVDGNIKSTFLANTGLPAQDNRILYTNSLGEINPLNNGNPGDVLTINSSNQPEWQPSAPAVFFNQLSAPLLINSPIELLISKSFDTYNDTVTLTLSLSGRVVSSSLANTLPLFPYELTIDVNGSTISKTFIHPNSNGASGASQGRFGTSWAVPIPTNYGNNLVEIFISKINPGSMDIEIDPAQGENASLIIMDLPNNE